MGKTNYERIKEMTPDEMEEFLRGAADETWVDECCYNCEPVGRAPEGWPIFRCDDGRECPNGDCLRWWLEREAKEAEAEIAEADSCERCDREDAVMPSPAVTSMDADREINILTRAVEHYGKISQVDMMLEEMSELTKALLKWRRVFFSELLGGDAMKAKEADVREEMADVQIMLNQMCLIFGDINDEEIAKLERLDARLREAGVK